MCGAGKCADKFERNKFETAWDYSAKECSANGKFGAEFEGHEIAMGAPSPGELRLCANVELLRGDVNLQSGFNGDANAVAQG